MHPGPEEGATPPLLAAPLAGRFGHQPSTIRSGQRRRTPVTAHSGRRGNLIAGMHRPPTAGKPRLVRDDRPLSTGLSATHGLTPELLADAARRLRMLALLYAFTFFMAGFFPRLLSAADRGRMAAEPLYFMSGVAAIAAALVVAGVSASPRVPRHVLMTVGLVFEVVGSYGIAAAEFLDPTRLDRNGWIGLSWVAVWTSIFTVIVPTTPRRAAMATLASVSAVPVIIGSMIAFGTTQFRPGPLLFFMRVVFPYLLVATSAYVSARVVYALRREVTKARELGSYRLVEPLAHGGMGEVWRARHRLLARPAAIKLIRLGTSDRHDPDAARRRFEREAQVTAQLQSPHTVRLFDFGIDNDGAFYYVMELLEGMDLEALVRQHGPVPAERALHFLRQACHSLAEAELHHLVHRDIKPANLLACRYGGEHDFLKVLDFGIVKARTGNVNDLALTVTQPQVLQGTPAYMAPEQALGDADVDHRADIYSLGCVAYWLLTGQLVFTADTTMGLLLEHARTTPTPPSERTELPIPAALDRLVLQCLAKNRGERPPSARELGHQLGEIVTATRWTEDRAQDWWLAHQPTATAAPAHRPRPTAS